MFRTGGRRRAGGVTVITAPGAEGMPRVGVVAGRRVGSAVARNRAKRRIREAMARVRLQDGADYIVVASEEVNEVPFGDLLEWLEAATRTSEG